MVALWYLDRCAETFTAETAANIAPPAGDPKPLKLTVYSIRKESGGKPPRRILVTPSGLEPEITP